MAFIENLLFNLLSTSTLGWFQNISLTDNEKLIGICTLAITIISIIISISATTRANNLQKRNHLLETFTKHAEHLHSDNESDRVASAILLRHFINIRNYNKRAVNLIVSLLKILPNGILQKTLGDGLSYAQRLRGQDFQGANLHNVLIKPKKYIRYELCDVPIIKQIRKSVSFPEKS